MIQVQLWIGSCQATTAGVHYTTTLTLGAHHKNRHRSSTYLILNPKFTMAAPPPSLNRPSSSAAPDAVPEKLLQTPSNALEAIEDIVYGSVSVTQSTLGVSDLSLLTITRLPA